jgi:thioesterase domain-containing protein
MDNVSRIPPNYRNLMQLHLKALTEYRPRPYPGRVTVFRTRRQPLFCSHDPQMAWPRLAQGGVEVRNISGSHRNLLQEPFVQSLASELGASIRQANNLPQPPV